MRAGWGGARHRLVAATLVALAGCTPAADGPVERPAPSQTTAAEPTTLASYGTEGVAVARAPFCDRVSPTGIEHALGDVAQTHDEHGNGDPIRLPDGSRSVAHEYGCTWRAADGTTARGWVFVPPVTPGWARQLVAQAGSGRCRVVESGRFGTPSVATACGTDDGAEVSWRGLFGDAWLVCSVAGPDGRAALGRRLEDWCVSVLDAARA